MYITPNSVIRILKNVPLDKTYEHTMYFGSTTAQAKTFIGYTKFLFNNQSYQRVKRGWIRIERVADDLYDCNYLMFQNSAYGNKWFYAFIKSVEYINNLVSEIEFEIDVMQTWFFDYTLEPCFVEREHTDSDALFEHLVEEKIDSGDLYNVQIVRNFYFDNTRLAIVCSGDAGSVPPVPYAPTVQGNLFTGLRYLSFDIKNNPNYAINFIKQYIDKGYEDAVLMVYQYPRFIGELDYLSTYAEQAYSFTPNFTNVDGYVPKNKKLFMYPYNYMSVSDKEGKAIELKWELWDSAHRGEFTIQGTAFGKPTVCTIPKYYREIVTDYESEITYDNFPVCAWAGDAYQVWLAQNRFSLEAKSGASTIGGVIGVVGGLAFTSDLAPLMIAGGVASLAGTVLNILGQTADAKMKTPKQHGGINASTINIQNGSSGFEFKQMTIKQEYARIIDEYFSKFGYACHRIKVPNRNVRNKWTYTKTVGCNIIGSLPADDAEKICKIYDAGITFWAYGITPGSYGDFTNAPIGS